MTGSGTAADPYIISDVDDLQAMEDHLGSYYELSGNIDASTTSTWNANAGFVPIGITTDKFSGQLKGKGYTISDLFIDRDATQYVGLFGKVDGNAGVVLNNIIMTGFDITGKSDVGTLVGVVENYGDPAIITDCSSAGTVATATSQSNAGGLIGTSAKDIITDCHSSCTVTAGDDYAGGLIGRDRYGSTVTGCYATGAVTAVDNYAGGLVGFMYGGTYSQCYATGNVAGDDYAGGLFGASQSSTIINCYARGDAAVALDDGYRAGGLIGWSYGDDIDNCYSTGAATGFGLTAGLIADESTGTVTNCFWDTETSGNATSDGGTGKTTAQMKTLSTFKGAGWNFDTIWRISTGTNNGYPFLGAAISGELAGLYAVVEERFHYVDAYGVERQIQGTAV